MAWEKRGNRSYFYHPVRENGRVVKKYFGAGPEAEMAAEMIQATREKRAISRNRMNDAKAKLKSIEQWDKPSPASPEATDATPHTTDDTSRTSSTFTPPEVLDRARALVKSCHSGDKNAEQELRELIDTYPTVMQRCGNLASIARSKWLTLAVGENSVSRTAAIKTIEELRSRFPKRQNPCSELLVERIVTTWLQLAYAENRMTELAPSDREGFEFFSRLQERAQRQHLRAIRMWETTEHRYGQQRDGSESSTD